jgi:hypothetical protein
MLSIALGLMAVEQPVLVYHPTEHARIDFASNEAVATAATRDGFT